MVGERALTPSWTVGNEPGVKGCVPSTFIAPEGAEVRALGDEEVVEEALPLEVLSAVGVELTSTTVDEVVDEILLLKVGKEDSKLVDETVLTQEHALEIFAGKLEQAAIQVGRATDVVASVYVAQNGTAFEDALIIALCFH